MYKVNDKRSMKVIFCSHCLLNQNAKLEGIAGWPGMINSVVDLIIESKAGIVQMPCPEMLYEGIGRFDKSVEQYNCFAFRSLSVKIAEEMIDQIENYIQWGYQVLAVLAMDGSPSCGYNLTQSAPEWRGLIAEQSWRKPRYIPERGVFMEILENQMKEKGLDVPIIGIPEIPELGSLDETINQLKRILIVE
jgi:predicted secreted protein